MVQCSAFRSSKLSFDTRSTDDGSETVGAFKTSETFELLGKSKHGSCRMQPRRVNYVGEDNAATESEGEFWMKCASSYLDDFPRSLFFASKQKKTRHIISWKSKRSPQEQIKQDPTNSIIAEDTFETTLEEYTSATSMSDSLSVNENSNEKQKGKSKNLSKNKGKVVTPKSSNLKKKSIAGAIEKLAKSYSSMTTSEVEKSDSFKQSSLLVLDLTAIDENIPKINGKDIPTIKVPSNPNTPRSTKRAVTPVSVKNHPEKPSIPKFIHGGGVLEVLKSRKSRGVDPPAKPAPEKKDPVDKSTSKYRYGSPEKARRSRSPQKISRRFYDLPACPSYTEPNPAQEADMPGFVSKVDTASTQESSDAHASKDSSVEDQNDSKLANESSKRNTNLTKTKSKSKQRSHRRSRSTCTPRGRKHKHGKDKSKKRSKSARPRDTPSTVLTKHQPTNQPKHKYFT